MNNGSNNNHNNTKNDPIIDLILESDHNSTDSTSQTDDLLNYLLNGNFSTPSLPALAPGINIATTAVSTSPINIPQTNYLNNMPVPEQRDSPPTTGTSHSEEEEPTEEQLKLLPSKERRQIRNKISARNFRNRRKEYIGSLEAKVTQYQAENSQLQLEVKWVRNMMEKLQAENDKLRLQLMMCKEGIQQPLSSDSVQPIADSNNSLSMNSWDPSRLNEFSTPQMTSYLSHAAIPDWDFSSIIPKTTTANQNQIDLLRTYPLLGPALMSIVLHHTFNMTTEELLTTSRITSILPGYHSPMTNTKDTRLQNDLLAKLLLTNPTQSNMQEEDQGENTEEKVGPQVVQYTFEDPPVTGFLAHCPIYWLQRRFCKFIISYVVVHYPQLESPCRTYLPICQRFRKRLTPA